MTIEDVMTLAPVIPVLVVEELAHAQGIAEALVAGGLRALEVTLRTPCALEAIKEMSKVPGVVVGAGTVLNAHDLDAALTAGARFIVSPGLTEGLGAAAIAEGVPYLPGIANATDLMRGFDLGLRHFKFFPAASSGGPPALKALSGPFQSAHFCPTGGVTLETAPEWLAIPQVLCVGGSWLVQKGDLDLQSIQVKARSAAAL